MDQIIENTEFSISYYLMRKAAAQGIPISGTFELTSRCNFNCKMCYIHNQNNLSHLKKKELSVEQWLSIAEDAKRNGMLFLLLTGGEAMLREDFIELYSKLAVMGFRITINSNGSLLNQNILECFQKYPPARVNISLYGACDETYQALCENKAFNKVRQSIHQLKEAGISVRVTMMLTPYNKDDMEAVYQIAKDENAICEMTSYMFPPTRVDGKCGVNQARLSSQQAGIYMARREKLLMGEKEFNAYLKSLEEIPKISIKEDVKEGRGIMCQAGRGAFWITWDGMMKPCGLMLAQEVSIIKEKFDVAWDKIRSITENIRLPKECVACEKQHVCQQCASVCQAETGRFDGKPVYMCELVEAKLKEYERLKENDKKDRKKNLSKL